MKPYMQPQLELAVPVFVDILTASPGGLYELDWNDGELPPQ